MSACDVHPVADGILIPADARGREPRACLIEDAHGRWCDRSALGHPSACVGATDAQKVPALPCATVWGRWREEDGTDRGSYGHKNWFKNPQFLLELDEDFVGECAVSLTCGPRRLSPSRKNDGGRRKENSVSPSPTLSPLDGAIGFAMFYCGSGKPMRGGDAHHVSYVKGYDKVTVTFDFSGLCDYAKSADANQFRVVPTCAAPGVEGDFALTVRSLGTCAGFTLEPIAPW